MKDSRIQWLTVHEHAQHQEGVESSNLRQLQRYSTRKAHTLENLEAMFEAQMVCVCVCVCVCYTAFPAEKLTHKRADTNTHGKQTISYIFV